MTPRISRTGESDTAPQEATGRKATYLSVAVLAGITSVLLTSLPFIISISIMSPGLFDWRGYAAFSFFSACAITPISVVIAYPLMIIFRKKGRLTRLAISIAAGIIMGVFVLTYLYHFEVGSRIHLFGAACGAAYGAVFGCVAIQVPTQEI